MLKTRFKPYMMLGYKTERMEAELECMLIEINFDDEIALVSFIEPLKNTQEHILNLAHLYIPKEKLRKIK